ncbi:MAG: kelch repeat-containing protein [Chloroflexota bacterium]
MPAAPVVPRSGAATEQTSDGRMVVFSGYDAAGSLLWDGAFFDPWTKTWSTYPTVPLTPRADFAFLTEPLDEHGSFAIWGGIAADGTAMHDGVAVTVGPGRPTSAARVRELPELPLTPGPATSLGGSEILTPGPDAASGPLEVVFQGWDDFYPVELPALPAGIALEGFIFGPVVYPAPGESIWALGSIDGYSTVSSAWPTGRGACSAMTLTFLRRATDDPGAPPVGIRNAPGSGSFFQRMAEPPAETATGGMLVRTPTSVIAADPLLAYDLDQDQWFRLPPLPDGPRTGVSATWADGRLWLWGGRTADGATPTTGWVFEPALPPDTFRLPGGPKANTEFCSGAKVDPRLRLHADRDDPDLAWFERDGTRVPAVWSDGTTIRFNADGAEVLSRDGAVRIKEGDPVTKLSPKTMCRDGRTLVIR